MASGGLVEVINNKGCSRLFIVPPGSPPPSSPPLSTPRPSSLTSPASMAIAEAGAGAPGTATAGPFAGLVICVTGLSKEVRKQVMVATERLGGQYSASLHPGCTHLVVQSFGGRKFEHAVKHGLKNGLLVVTVGWFVDSVRRNVRMSEALYDVKSVGEIRRPLHESNLLAGCGVSEKSCTPPRDGRTHSNITLKPHLQAAEKETTRRRLVLSNKVIHVDPNVSNELKKKVVDAALAEGATCTDQWFVGCRASHVVCEGPYVQRYIGHANNLVTPLWILKSVKEKHVQRLVHLSSDLARHVAMTLENVQASFPEQDANGQNTHQAAARKRESLISPSAIKSLEERQKIVEMAKISIQNRRSRRIQSYQTIIQPITPGNLLDSICWSVSEPTSSASLYTDHRPGSEDHLNDTKFVSALSDKMDLDASFSNLSRPLKESEKGVVILKTHFLTILFPVDRFGELGPSSRTFFSDGGFTCLQVLDLIYSFYQEKMPAEEVALAIHTDSKHADSLRSLYASKDASDARAPPVKRIDFLGSRRSFEVLKRVPGENYCSVYELVIRA